MISENNGPTCGLLTRILFWMMLGLIGLMILTGFDIHGSLGLLGYQLAVSIHNFVFIGLLILCCLLVAAAVTVNKRKPAITPASKKFDMNILYRATGISRTFQNPLFRHIYFTIGLAVLFMQTITGALYFGHNYWSALNLDLPLRMIAYVHTAGAYIITAYMILHVYLTLMMPKLTRSEQGLELHRSEVLKVEQV